MKLREKKLQRVVYVESFLVEIFQREREREGVVFKRETDKWKLKSIGESKTARNG